MQMLRMARPRSSEVFFRRAKRSGALYYFCNCCSHYIRWNGCSTFQLPKKLVSCR